MSRRLLARAAEKSTCAGGGGGAWGTSEGFESCRKMAVGWGWGGRRVKGAVFHLINNTNQIMQCSTVL